MIDALWMYVLCDVSFYYMWEVNRKFGAGDFSFVVVKVFILSYVETFQVESGMLALQNINADFCCGRLKSRAVRRQKQECHNTADGLSICYKARIQQCFYYNPW
jgi:hypothetical protein